MLFSSWDSYCRPGSITCFRCRGHAAHAGRRRVATAHVVSRLSVGRRSRLRVLGECACRALHRKESHHCTRWPAVTPTPDGRRQLDRDDRHADSVRQSDEPRSRPQPDIVHCRPDVREAGEPDEAESGGEPVESDRSEHVLRSGVSRLPHPRPQPSVPSGPRSVLQRPLEESPDSQGVALQHLRAESRRVGRTAEPRLPRPVAQHAQRTAGLHRSGQQRTNAARVHGSLLQPHRQHRWRPLPQPVVSRQARAR